VLGALSLACTTNGATGEDRGLAAQATPVKTSESATVPAPPAPGEPRWRTTYALEQHLRGEDEGGKVTANPLIEVVDDLRGDAETLFAIHREGPEPSLRIERWRFATLTREGMSATGMGEALLRLHRGDPPAADLHKFRVFTAIPGNKVLRRDSALSSVDALLASLASAAPTIRDPEATGERRTAALGELVADLDDALVLERDVLYRVIDTFAAGPPEIREREDLSGRRIRFLIDGPRGPLQIEALKLQGGWVLRDLRLPPEDLADKAEPK